MAHFYRYTLLFWLSFTASTAFALDDDWRQQAKAYLAEGKPNAALFLVHQAADAVRQQSDMPARVNMLRYIGEISWLAGDKNEAHHQFHEAMRYALKLPEPWRRLSAAISVCELHQKTIAMPDRQRKLMTQPLDARLLNDSAADIQASDTGRYITCFDGAADPAMATTLLDQIHLIPRQEVRKKALNALTEISFDLSNTPRSFNLTSKPHHDADTLEKILWNVVAARICNTPRSQVRAEEHRRMAMQLVSTLPKAEQPRAKKIVARLDSPA